MVEYRLLGRTGVNVAPLALGTDNFADPTPEDECTEILERAMDAGINLIATGDVYADGEGEKVIGRILKANGRRHEVLIGTKVDHGRRRVGVTLEDHTDEIGPNECGHSRLNIIRACEQSLTRMQTDYIDLYQLHRPSPEIPFDEILRALDDLVRAGKVRYIGCSTHPAWMVAEAVMTSELKGYVRFVAEESPYNLLDRRIENELICSGRQVRQRIGLSEGLTSRSARRLLRRPCDRARRRGWQVIRQIGRGRRHQRRSAFGALVQGPTGRDGTADRTTNHEAPGGHIAGIGDDPER